MIPDSPNHIYWFILIFVKTSFGEIPIIVMSIIYRTIQASKSLNLFTKDGLNIADATAKFLTASVQQAKVANAYINPINSKFNY
jgi:hypothetical protein